jgi:hypothetical protein
LPLLDFQKKKKKIFITLQLYNISNIAEVNVILPNSDSNNIEKLIIVMKEQVTIKRHVKSNLISNDLTSEAITQELTLRV